MFDLFGSGMPLAARFFVAFLVVLALIGATAWLVRRFGANRLGGGSARGRQPRLAVIDAANVDGRRRLVLIRRDNIEHLLMIGGPSDVVIEPNIVRAAPARETPREPVRAEPSLRPVAPPPPAPETAWPLQPAHEAPPATPVAPARAYRASPTEEPWLPPEPGARPRPAESLSELAAEFSSRFAQPEAPPVARHEPRPEPVPPEPVATEKDRNLAEVADQLEAALRRVPEAPHPPATDSSTVPPASPAPPKAETSRMPPREFKPRSESKFEPKVEPKVEPKREAKFEPRSEPKFEHRLEAKPEAESKPAAKAEAKPEAKPEPALSQTFYDNLEEEMASLLGRPPGKS